MSSLRIEQKSYEMHPPDGFTVAHFNTVVNIDRSADFCEKVFGGRILSRGDSKGASGHIQIANTWLIVNVGGGPTPDKPSVTLSVPGQGPCRSKKDCTPASETTVDGDREARTGLDHKLCNF